MEEKFADYGEVQIKQLNDRSKMYYTPNKENNVFQLVVQYGPVNANSKTWLCRPV